MQQFADFLGYNIEPVVLFQVYQHKSLMHMQSCRFSFDVPVMLSWSPELPITFATLKKLEKSLEGNWTEVTFAKTSGSVARDRGKIG